MKKKITVVIVTYNGAFWIRKNLNSLLQSVYPVQIIVVDNASTDSTVAILKQFSDIQIIESPTNLGFGKANNIGIKTAIESGAEAIFLLNQDTWIFDNTISILIEKMNINPEFGIVSPMHFETNGITLDANFKTYFDKKTSLCKDQNLAIVPFVNAAAWLIPKQCFEKMGFFDPVFNHYGEDRHFCERLHYHNYQIAIATDASICHDRKIVRNFNKDVLQSQYAVLNSLLNINFSFIESICLALKQVFGLPKYFYSYYGFKKTAILLLKLSGYFFYNVFNLNSLITIRKTSKLGTNGYATCQ